MDDAIIGTVEGLERQLAVDALKSRPMHEIIDDFAWNARKGGLSIARVMFGWRLLNPQFFSQSLYWRPDTGVTVERFRHGEATNSPGFLASPIHALLNSEATEIRRRIAGANAQHDFPILAELAAEGFTDYLIMKVSFGEPELNSRPGAGVMISFVSDRPGGFLDAELAGLRRLQHMLALALRTAMQDDMRLTLARTYLGRSAAQKVLGGQIARGEGEAVEAVIWYCDLRDSTGLCETLGVEAYLPLLNDYFSAAARPVTAAGGDILDFIGDAVLAIFPHSERGLKDALAATREATDRLEELRRGHPALAGRMALADVAGIAMDTGRVVHGNIGIPERLTFSVIGATVNKVARLERLTKTLREPVLATRLVAEAAPGEWRSCGAFPVDGFRASVEVFAPCARRLAAE